MDREREIETMNTKSLYLYMLVEMVSCPLKVLAGPHSLELLESSYPIRNYIFQHTLHLGRPVGLNSD